VTEESTIEVQPLADLLDSRQDLREILANNLNLAHACLLLRRGESDAVEKALDLALRQSDPDSAVVAECIRVELLRLAGEVPQALVRAEALARTQRFHPAAVLYLRNLFPLVDPAHHLTDSVVHEAGPDTLGEHDVPVAGQAGDSQAMEAPSETVRESDLPVAWSPIAADPGVVLLRLRSPEGVRERRREDVAIGALEDIVFSRSGKVLEGLGLGELRHAAFEGSARSVHAWNNGDRSALIVIAAGGSASLLAARGTKAFQDPR
jgi:hypothetical protein